MKYYKIFKNGEMIGHGMSNSIPEDDKTFTYQAITKLQYEKLDKSLWNSKA